MNSIRYFLYARKSSEAEDRQVQSIQDQIEVMGKIAQERSINVVEVFSEAKSAKAPDKRPVFSEMLKRIRNGEANGILCWQLNRLSRNPVDSGELQWLLQEGILQSIKTNDREYLPSDNAVIMSVESSVANQFIIDLRKNTKRGLHAKFERGEFPGLAPLGYVNKTIIDDHGIERQVIEPDPDCFDLVRKMFDLLLSGSYNPLEIHAIALNEWGLANVRGKRRRGLPISKSSIYRIFNNKFYVGIVQYAGMERAGVHKPMLTMEEFDRVQAILGSKGKPRKQTYEFPYTGIMRCVNCGCAITAETKHKFIKADKKVKPFTYYRCTRRKNTTSFRCTEPTVTKEELTNQFVSIVQTVNLPKEIIKWAFEVIDSQEQNIHADKTKLKQTQDQAIQAKRQQIQNLIAMRSSGLIDDDQFRDSKMKFEAELQSLEKALAKNQNTYKRLELIKEKFEFIVNCPPMFTEDNPKTQRMAAKKLCASYQLSNGELKYVLQPWYQPFQNYHDQIMEWLEPIKHLDNKRKSEAFASLIPILGERRDLNPRPTVPQTAALPLRHAHHVAAKEHFRDIITNISCSRGGNRTLDLGLMSPTL